MLVEAVGVIAGREALVGAEQVALTHKQGYQEQ
jgi:hypothetical protein